MNIKIFFILLIVIMFSAIPTNASLKVYLIHGYAGPGFEMENIPCPPVRSDLLQAAIMLNMATISL